MAAPLVVVDVPASALNQETRPVETPPGAWAKLATAISAANHVVRSVFIVFFVFGLDRAKLMFFMLFM